MKWAAFAFVFVLGLAVAGCGDPAGTQYLPIGSRCSSSGQCGTTPFVCNASAGYTGGYCEKPCTTDGDCPADSLCNPSNKSCRRRCKSASDCRVDEGYGCFVLTGGNGVCEPGAAMDGGAP